MKNTDAFKFLVGLQNYINERIPASETMTASIKRIVEESKLNEDTHKRFPEGALLNQYITPNINSYLVESMSLSSEQATKSLLSESFRKLPMIASASPTRLEPHPFQKSIGLKPQEIMSIWRGEKKSLPITRSAPDIALRSPCPYSVVFEGKYFPKGGISAAETALVTGIYQTFFYLGLAKHQETETHPAWDYEYSCLIAYDASEGHSLKKAWESLDPSVRKACWNGANIFVMILTGSW